MIVLINYKAIFKAQNSNVFLHFSWKYTDKDFGSELEKVSP